MASTDCNISLQLSKSRINRSKPLRIELQPSPYSAYTQKQLDMRRKANILQYSAVNSNTKTNNLTKKEKFALLTKGSAQKISGTNTTANSCDNLLILVPTSSSDVPGKVEYLYNDMTVPLYNPSASASSKNGKNYISDPTTYTTKWEMVATNNIKCPNETSTYFSTLYVRDAIDAYIYRYSMTIPLSIDISGTLNSTKYNSDLDFTRNDVIVSISEVSCLVYYNDVLLNTPGLANTVVPIYNKSNLSSFTMRKVDTDINPDFNATIYVGDLTVGNIQLFTSSTYVYDFVFNYTVKIDTQDNDYLITDYFTKVPNMNVIMNVSSDYIDISGNCTISNQPVWTGTTFSLNGEIAFLNTTDFQYRMRFHHNDL